MRPPLLLLLLCLPFASLAQDCGDDAPARITQAYQQRDTAALPGRSGWSIDSERGACRVWPADTSLTLIAVPFLGPEGPNRDSQSGDLDVLVVDSASLRPRAALRLPDVMSSDAIHVDSVGLDTARYNLSPSVRAFGVRSSRSNSSQPNPFSETRLQLLVFSDNLLEAITGQIVVSSSGGEWDTRCAGEFHETKRTLEVGPAPAQGWATLTIRQRGSSTVNHEDATGDCVEAREEQPVRSFKLLPKGRSYPLPSEVEAAF
ncbi:MAG TPA: hypothetical protein VF513_12295 [Stenotrophomonas sp.]